mgnify:CR=1 FL=1
MKKIGIITHYHKSHNYGGILQAYALSRYLNESGFSAEQISYHLSSPAVSGESLKVRIKRLKDPKHLYNAIAVRIGAQIDKMIRSKIKTRHEALERFATKEIPHSEQVYTKQTISECQIYDAYITGSDQVWNPDWYHSAFFLDFVSEGKPNIAYAARLGKSELTQEQQRLYQEKLSDFTAISVREQDAVDVLQPISPVDVEWVLDPTLLLTRKQWDDVASERLIPGQYIFTYFLGEDKQARKLVSKFAKKRGLRIVTLPYLLDKVCMCDVCFGDEKLYQVSPADFLSLIKYADYVFTDSFHATLFSHVYEREVVVFQRMGRPGMSGRIYSLMSLFHSTDHFCDCEDKRTMRYIEGLGEINYSSQRVELNRMRNRSVAFLRDNLVG